MRVFTILSFVFLSCFASALHTPPDGNISLKLHIEGIKSNDGQIFILLYNYENQYPRTPYRSIKVPKKDLVKGALTHTIPALKHGKYGVIILDDANANETLDFSIIGVPSEGYAFSNNQKPGFLSLPKYNSILFEVSSSHNNFKIAMQYNDAQGKTQ